MSTVIFYHANCLDGFTAAWLLYEHFDCNADLVPVFSFDRKPREVWDKEVFVVDGCFRLGQMVDMARQCAKLTIIDHHEETIDLLRSNEFMVSIRGKNFRPIIDVKSCSTKIVNRCFTEYTGGIRCLLDYVEDIDLKKYSLPDSRAVEAYMMAVPQNPDRWHMLSVHMAEDIGAIVKKGLAILYRQQADVINMVEQSIVFVDIGGYQVPVANVPPTHTQAALDYMLEKGIVPNIAAVYFDSPTRRNYTLKAGKGFDVKPIVARYGGKGDSFSIKKPMGL